jgi:hypothetical protein
VYIWGKYTEVRLLHVDGKRSPRVFTDPAGVTLPLPALRLLGNQARGGCGAIYMCRSRSNGGGGGGGGNT